jgi:acetyltransferase-like isoleucine patch superfamily enzyme
MIAPGVYISVGNESVLTIGPHSYIGHDAQINSRSSVSIGSGCLIGQRTQIMDYDGHPIFADGSTSPDDSYGGRDAPVVIGNNVWVGFGAMIFKGVTIGDGAIIGAGAVVRKNVPPRTMVLGNPAVVVREGVTWRKF